MGQYQFNIETIEGKRIKTDHHYKCSGGVESLNEVLSHLENVQLYS
jgi:hypothetical protein